MWIFTFIVSSIVSSVVFYVIISALERSVFNAKNANHNRRQFNPTHHQPIVINNYIPSPTYQHDPVDYSQYDDQINNIRNNSQQLFDEIHNASIAINRDCVSDKYDELHGCEDTAENKDNVVDFNSFRRKNG